MRRLPAVLALLGAVFALSAPATPRLELERVVLVQRHGVRPPTVSNADIAKFADKPWPVWPVAPGELTPHGGKVVALMGKSLRGAYVRDGVLPAHGCPSPSAVIVWADQHDQRTRRSGEILAESLAPGCGIKAAWSQAAARDPIFGTPAEGACRADPAAAKASMDEATGPGGVPTPASQAAIARLQTILAPKACNGGAGTCLADIREEDAIGGGQMGPQFRGPTFTTFTLAEDIYLEYVEGMPMADVGWGRATPADIRAVMPVHERVFDLFRREVYSDDRRGASMARVILAALSGAPITAIPGAGPNAKVLALAGHDGNLAIMAGVFGLEWTLPDQPDATAPATTLAFELWKDPASGKAYVRPVLYYDAMEQMRALTPALAHKLPLHFKDCDDGPMGSCPLETLRARIEAAIPPDCGGI